MSGRIESMRLVETVVLEIAVEEDGPAEGGPGAPPPRLARRAARMASGRAAVARARLADDRARAARLGSHALPLGRRATGRAGGRSSRGRPRAVGRARPRA